MGHFFFFSREKKIIFFFISSLFFFFIYLSILHKFWNSFLNCIIRAKNSVANDDWIDIQRRPCLIHIAKRVYMYITEGSAESLLSSFVLKVIRVAIIRHKLPLTLPTCLKYASIQAFSARELSYNILKVETCEKKILYRRDVIIFTICAIERVERKWNPRPFLWQNFRKNWGKKILRTL